MNKANTTGRDLAVDLANTYEQVAAIDHLTSVTEMVEFAAGHGFDADADVRSLNRLRKVRHELRQALSEQDEARAVAGLNALLAKAHPNPHLARSFDGSWAFQYADPYASLADQMIAAAASGLLAEVAEHGVNRLHSCRASDCGDVFVDTSRNHSRRYCSAAGCGNREAQRAFRARQAAKEPTR